MYHKEGYCIEGKLKYADNTLEAKVKTKRIRDIILEEPEDWQSFLQKRYLSEPTDDLEEGSLTIFYTKYFPDYRGAFCSRSKLEEAYDFDGKNFVANHEPLVGKKVNLGWHTPYKNYSLPLFV